MPNNDDYKQMTKILSTETGRIPFKVYFTIGVVSGTIALVITAALAVFKLCSPSFPEFMEWTGAGACFLPLVSFVFEKYSLRKGMNAAYESITKKVAVLADSSSLPTKPQIRELITKKTPIHLTVNGVSGAVLVAKNERVRSDYGRYDDSTAVVVSLATQMPESGVANFQRLLARAIDGNKDIKAATEKVIA